MKKNLSIFRPLFELTIKMLMVFSAFLLFSSIVLDLGWAQGVKFGLFQIFIVLLPGFSLALLLNFKQWIKTDVEWFGFSYVFGWILNLFFYLLIRLCGDTIQNNRLLICVCIIIVSLSVILICLGKVNYLCEKDSKGNVICIVFMIILLCFDFIVYSANNFLPYQREVGYIYGDITYWVGNTIELVKEFPPKDFRNYPQPYNYHYFSSMQLALAVITTGIKPIVISIAYEYLQSITILVFGAYVLFTHLCRKRKAIIVLAMIILFFSCGAEGYITITYIHHMYLSPFGFDYGIGLMLFGWFFLHEFFRDQMVKPFISFLLPLFCIVVTGTKSSCGVVFLVGAGFICFVKLVKKENLLHTLFTGIIVLSAFLFMYFMVVNASGYSGASNSEYFSDILHNPFARKRNEGMDEHVYLLMSSSCPRIIKLVLFAFLLLIYDCMVNPAIFILEGIAIFRAIKHKKIFDGYNIAVYMSIIISMCLTLCIRMFGASEMYFAMSGVSMGICLYLYNCDNDDMSEIRWLSMAAGIGLSFMMLLNGGNILIYKIYNGIQMLSGKEITFIDKCPNISNIEKGLLDASEQLLIVPGNKSVTNANPDLVGVIAEKYMMRDEEYKGLFEDNDIEKKKNVIQSLKRNGITSFLLDRKNLDYMIYNYIEGIEMLYENDRYAVYLVK